MRGRSLYCTAAAPYTLHHGAGPPQTLGQILAYEFISIRLCRCNVAAELIPATPRGGLLLRDSICTWCNQAPCFAGHPMGLFFVLPSFLLSLAAKMTVMFCSSQSARQTWLTPQPTFKGHRDVIVKTKPITGGKQMK